MSQIEVATFVVLPLVLVALFAWATLAAWQRAGDPPARARRVMLLVTLTAAAWMGVTWTAASRGVLLDFTSKPPPFGLLVAVVVTLSIVIAAGPLGRRFSREIPLWALVAVHAFRLPLEIAMHRLAERGIMPDQMSYAGRNYDIVTGITAIIVAVLVRRGIGGRRLVLAWNLLGFALLVNIVTVAILSTPPFAVFGPNHLNVFVMVTPFVWLPAVLVLAALAGHLVIFRALRMERPV
jgi:hypothetical protein